MSTSSVEGSAQCRSSQAQYTAAFCCLFHDPRHQRFLGLLLLLLRTQRQRWNTFGLGQREQGRQQRQGISLGKTIVRKSLLEFAELGLRRILALQTATAAAGGQ